MATIAAAGSAPAIGRDPGERQLKFGLDPGWLGPRGWCCCCWEALLRMLLLSPHGRWWLRAELLLLLLLLLLLVACCGWCCTCWWWWWGRYGAAADVGAVVDVVGTVAIVAGGETFCRQRRENFSSPSTPTTRRNKLERSSLVRILQALLKGFLPLFEHTELGWKCLSGSKRSSLFLSMAKARKDFFHLKRFSLCHWSFVSNTADKIIVSVVLGPRL